MRGECCKRGRRRRGCRRRHAVQTAIQREVEVIVPDELPQVGRAEIILLCAESVVEVEGVDAQLVRHDHIGVIRHTAGHPVVAADGLQPPDLVHILESDAVHLIGAVGFQQLAQTEHALAGRMDVGQDEVNNILLADAAGDFRLAVPGGLIDHQRVCAQNAGVEVIVSVAVMPTLAALTPEAARCPCPPRRWAWRSSAGHCPAGELLHER